MEFSGLRGFRIPGLTRSRYSPDRDEEEKIKQLDESDMMKIVLAMDIAKVKFHNPLVASLIEFLRRDTTRTMKNRDLVFYEMARMLAARKQESGTGVVELPKPVVLQRLIQFIYGDPKTLKPLVGAGSRVSKFDNVIFLTLVVSNELLNSNSQKGTFDEVLKMMGFGDSIKKELNIEKEHRQILGEVKGIQKRSKNKRSAADPRTYKCRKDRSGFFSKILSVDCDREVWAKIFAEFPQGDLAKAANKIIFE